MLKKGIEGKVMTGGAVYFIIFFLCGIFPLQCFREVISPRLKYFSLSYVVYATSLGSMLFITSVLAIGHFGFRVDNTTFYTLAVVFSVASLLTLVLDTRKSRLVETSEEKGLTSRSSLVWEGIIYLPILLFLAAVTWAVLTRYMPSWDHFTFWLVEAKDIFLRGELRTSPEINNFSYTAYYPLHAVFLHSWYGFPVEQFASLFTLMYAFFSSVIVLHLAKPLGRVGRALVSATILIILYSVLPQMVTFYAEVVNSFFVVLFVSCVVSDSPREHYFRRVLLLAWVLICFSFIKPTNIYYVAALALFWFLYDFKDLVKASILRSVSGWEIFWFAYLILIVASRFYYLNYVFEGEFQKYLFKFRAPNHLWERFDYFDGLFDLLVTNYTLVTVLLVLVAYEIITASKYERKTVFLAAVIFALPFINVLHYFVSHYSLTSKSILRYVQTIFFVIPLFFAFQMPREVRPERKKLYAGLAGLCILIFPLLFIYDVVYDYRLPSAKRHSGRYIHSERLEIPFTTAEKIRDVVGDDTVVIANDEYDKISNMSLKSITLRYFLLENLVSPLHRGDRKQFEALLQELRPRYLYVQKLNDSLKDLLQGEGEQDNSLYSIEGYEPLKFKRVAFSL